MDQNEPQVLRNRIAHFFLGVHKFTTVATTSLEMDWLDPEYERRVKMARYKNRLCSMKEERLPVNIYKWMESLEVNGWVKDVKHVLNYANMDDCQHLSSKCDLNVLQVRLKVLNQDKWWLDAETKTKLETFIQIYHRSDPQGLMKCNLQRNQRSVVSRLKCGVLPLMLEVGRFKNMPQ